MEAIYVAREASAITKKLTNNFINRVGPRGTSALKVWYRTKYAMKLPITSEFLIMPRERNECRLTNSYNYELRI